MTTVSAEAMEKGTVSVPRNVKNIGTQYKGRTDIVRMILHPGIRKIGDCAFEGCTSLKEITIPESVEHIGQKAFYGCTALETLCVDSNNPNYRSVDGALYTKDMDLVAYPAGCDSKRFIAPEQTVTVADYAFCGNPFLRSVEFGSQLTDITGLAFDGCVRLASIIVSVENENFISTGYGLYSGDRRTLISVPPKMSIALFQLYGVEEIAPYSLYQCDRIQGILFHDCLETVSPLAFGEKCRPKKILVEKDFDCDLPFAFVDKDSRPLEGGDIRGYLFRREKDGNYRALRKLTRSDMIELPTDEEMELAFGTEMTESEFRPVKVLDTTFDDIAGLDDAKEQMYRYLILPSKHPELFKRFKMETSTGILLYGPPGTGKTMLARAVASEIDAKFYSIKSTDIRGCYVGESEKRMRALFETARRDRRAVIFFDDFDSLGRERGNSGEPWQSDLINELLVQMQGLERHADGLMVLAATNRPWEIDSALMRSGRFSTHIHVGLPDAEARGFIVRHRMDEVPHSDSLDYDTIVRRTEGYNAADVEEVCNAAKIHRISLVDAGDGEDHITNGDFAYALTKVRSSVSRRDLEDLDRYRRTGNGPGVKDDYVPGDTDVPGYS